MRLLDKVAVVTGGARGIGRAIAEGFAREGARVVILDLDGAAINGAVAEIKGSHPEVYGYELNVVDSASVGAVFAQIIQGLGTIDILVNNAGITADGQLYKMTDEEWDRVIAVNLKGVFNCSREAVKCMRQKEYGKIINISSVVGLYGNFGQVNYAATKAGVIGMTKSMAKEVGRKNITVNAVCPGFIETEMTAKMPEKVLAMMQEKAPLNRLGKPVDVANACVFLASEESSFVTGAVLSVDGGIVL
jgi:3-oxoacyl-[acyl-carrier protein] reductase